MSYPDWTAFGISSPDQGDRWNHLYVNKYKHTFYLSYVSGDASGLEVEPNKGVRAMDPLAASSHQLADQDQLTNTWVPLITSARK